MIFRSLRPYALTFAPLGTTDFFVAPLGALVTEINPLQITFYNEIAYIVYDNASRI